MAGLWRNTVGALFGTALCLPPLLFVRDNIWEVVPVKGASMYPFLNTDRNITTARDLLLIWKWEPTKNLQRGMIVSFWAPHDPEISVVKRVIALEGDRVQTRAPYTRPHEIVPQGHVWVEGDHPEGRESLDSNYYGPIPQSLITGQVRAVVWPYRRAAWVDWQHWRNKPGKVTEGVLEHMAEVYGPY